jgi:hypothetical protein
MRLKARRQSIEGLFMVLLVFAFISVYVLHRLIAYVPSHPDRRLGQYSAYKSAPVETDMLAHLGRLGFNTHGNVTSSGCKIMREQPDDVKPAILSIHKDLLGFREDLQAYRKALEDFEGIGDLRLKLGGRADVCAKVDLHEKGLLGIFKSGQLSHTRSGFVEPLIPAMRHPEFCFNETFLLDPGYLVHDFGAMCRKLKKTSRIVLVDMGASLSFHEALDAESPTMYLVRLFRKFGFPVDHIYAYEITPTPSWEVYERLPMEIIPAYHWINVAVEGDIGHRNNPFTHIAAEFNEDDFIMVKLDIDTPKLETILSHQLLNETVGRLVDQFYFEKHVHLSELSEFWAETMEGSVKDAMMFFYDLRRAGIPAHFWV